MASLFSQANLQAPYVPPVDGYQVILADPPWHYNNRKACGSNSRFGGGAMKHYAVMADVELLALPVGSIAADDAVLFLWATWPRLPLALRLIEAWGFAYKTCAFDWFKVSPGGALFHGVGFYSKSNSEPCLLATKGKPLKPATNAVSMALEDWDTEAFKDVRREHSRKPDAVRQRIEQLYPYCSKVELFARQQVAGWDCWGNEVSSSVQIA